LSPLTTITILVYDLVKVNPTTRALPALATKESSAAFSCKKNRKRLLYAKKSSQQLSNENRRGQRHADSTAKPFCKMEMSTDLARHSASKPYEAEIRGILRRLWISHLISTG
jgi:hypothetical protein